MNSSEQKHALSQEAQENLPNETTPESLAYVMYTSGSTGRPKGTEIRHISILRLVFGTHFTRLDETRTILHMASISFDAATLEVWGALLHGGRCVLFPEKIPTPTGIGAAVRKHGVTTAWITASLFNAIIDDAPEALQGIEHIMTGGEALSVVHMRRALELLPNTNLTNGYGPTESTTFACCYPIPRQLPSETRSISIGSPIGNTQVYILDKHLQPVPVGVPGELHIGGLGLARGYFKRPELTREKFIQHPFSDDPEARLYKTGDRVRWLPNGTIEFLGRFDQQVKLRGFRIELGEIESVLGQAGGVREALVQARENARHEKFLVAYVIPQAGESTTESQLRKFLKDRLPEFMIPADFILLESLPLTPNGKLDERALPAPQSSHQSKEDSYVAPDQTLHYQLVQIWEDLLNVKPIGIRDNFFALGGHSLLAARLVDRIEQVSGKKIPMATLFAGATIEHLAEVIMGEEQAESLTPVVAVQPKGHKRPFFYLHGDWTGGSFYCLNLARELGPDQPFYILEPYKFAGMAIPPSFEEMAAAHIQMMRSVQPEGPYLLGGFCNGGLVAYEVARQLQNAGEQVDLLVLIDPATPTPHGNVRNRLARIGKLTRSGQDRQLEWWLRIGHMYRYWRLANYRELKDTEYLDSLPPSKAAARKGRLGRAMFKAKSFLSNSKALREYWTAIYEWIAAGYIPGPYRGKITLFWDREDPFRRNDWLGIMQDKEVEEFTIEGSHMSCRAEHLPSLVQHLKACLEMVQAREKEASTV